MSCFDSFVSRAKSLFAKGEAAGALDILKIGSEERDAMSCLDAGFMIIQGIGCEKDVEKGFQLIMKGHKLKATLDDDDWKIEGSVTELFEGQTLEFSGLFFSFRVGAIYSFCFSKQIIMFMISEQKR